MSFDARSRDRLEALGRTLPQKLPTPTPRQPPAADPGAAAAPRHRVESEQDPEALFHALMEASPDGSVPPHLLERLRGLEQSRPDPALASAPSAPQTAPSSSGGSPTPPRRRRGPAAADNRLRRPAGSDRDLYDAFDDLLRGDDDGPQDPPPPSRLPADPRLMPRPTLRAPRSF